MTAMNSLDQDAWYDKLQSSRREGPQAANGHWQKRIEKENENVYKKPALGQRRSTHNVAAGIVT